MAPDGNGKFGMSGEGAVFDPKLALNNQGHIAFGSNLSNTAGGSADNRGIFLFDGTNVVQVARTGQPLAGSTVVSLTFSTSLQNPNGSGLNDQMQVAYRASTWPTAATLSPASSPSCTGTIWAAATGARSPTGRSASNRPIHTTCSSWPRTRSGYGADRQSHREIAYYRWRRHRQRHFEPGKRRYTYGHQWNDDSPQWHSHTCPRSEPDRSTRQQRNAQRSDRGWPVSRLQQSRQWLRHLPWQHAIQQRDQPRQQSRAVDRRRRRRDRGGCDVLRRTCRRRSVSSTMRSAQPVRRCLPARCR